VIAMPLTKTSLRLTESDYLALERAAEFKSEFFDGEMFAMAGGTAMHSLIATNVAGEFINRLRGRPYVPFNADLRIKVEKTGLLTYPDLSFICGALRFVEGTDDTVINPTLLVEVLSDSTEAYDRGRKFENYREIPSLKEYLLVSQKDPRAELFIRQGDGRWLLQEAAGLQATLAVPSLEITLALSEIFANVQFAPTTIRPRTPGR